MLRTGDCCRDLKIENLLLDAECNMKIIGQSSRLMSQQLTRPHQHLTARLQLLKPHHCLCVIEFLKQVEIVH